jgi:peptidase E
VFYVGGGNTANLLSIWRAHRLDQILTEQDMSPRRVGFCRDA